MSTYYSGTAIGTVRANGWLSAEDADNYWAEGEPGTLNVARVDEDEIRLAFVLRDSDTEDVGLYLSVHDASQLALLLGAAVFAEGDPNDD